MSGDGNKRLFVGIFIAYFVFFIFAMRTYIAVSPPDDVKIYIVGLLVYICVFSMIDMVKYYMRWRYNIYGFTGVPHKK